MDSSEKTKFLRWAMMANATFSALCGIVLFGAADPVAASLGVVDRWWFQAIGVVLLIFSLDLVLIARKQHLSLPLAMLIILADIGWFIASIVILLVWPGIFSKLAVVAIAAVSVVVFVFAILQILGVLRALRNERDGPRVAVEFQRKVDVPPALAWSVVSDVAGYSNYAPSIKSSRILEGSGKGMLRECADPNGGRWTEQCTFWNEGEAYGFRINTGAADYPYPFVELRAEWRVIPERSGSLIYMRFEATMPWGILGELMLAAVMAKYNADVKSLLDNWEQSMLSMNTTQGNENTPSLQIFQQT